MTIEHFVEQLKREFLKNRIARKTGWGKNEIEKEFEEALSVVLLKYVDGTHV